MIENPSDTRPSRRVFLFVPCSLNTSPKTTPAVLCASASALLGRNRRTGSENDATTRTYAVPARHFVMVSNSKLCDTGVVRNPRQEDSPLPKAPSSRSWRGCFPLTTEMELARLAQNRLPPPPVRCPDQSHCASLRADVFSIFVHGIFMLADTARRQGTHRAPLPTLLLVGCPTLTPAPSRRLQFQVCREGRSRLLINSFVPMTTKPTFAERAEMLATAAEDLQDLYTRLPADVEQDDFTVLANIALVVSREASCMRAAVARFAKRNTRKQ